MIEIEHNITDRRYKKLYSVLEKRQFSLKVVLENIHDPHNVSAIFRSCDSVGVPNVSLLYSIEKFPKRIGDKSSSSAKKWVGKEKYTSVDECYSTLRKDGFVIYATDCSPEACSMYELDFTQKCAIVVGNEHRGVSDEAQKNADKTFYIPMVGMIQSLNVSVATAVVLYEAFRQRKAKGMYEKQELDEDNFKGILTEWVNK